MRIFYYRKPLDDRAGGEFGATVPDQIELHVSPTPVQLEFFLIFRPLCFFASLNVRNVGRQEVVSHPLEQFKTEGKTVFRKVGFILQLFSKSTFLDLNPKLPRRNKWGYVAPILIRLGQSDSKFRNAARGIGPDDF